MEDWQQRVVQEREELSQRLAKLDAFMEVRGRSLGDDQLSLLQDQRTAMNAYLMALEARIATF